MKVIGNLKVIFNIDAIDDASALNMIDEVMICSEIKFEDDSCIISHVHDGNMQVPLKWIKEIEA